MKFFLLSGSLRKGSFNLQLVKAAAAILGGQNHEREIHSLGDFPLPVYDGDFEEKNGVPASAKSLTEKIIAANAVIISAPEYNGGIAGGLKNAIDWTSRLKPHPWTAKPTLLLGASPGAMAAVRGLWHSRVPLEVLGAYVFPEMFGVGKANEAFAPEGNLKDPAQSEKLGKILERFTRFSENR
jgi:chromate reductase, NAD(P)H dehydrogenase (quinone)